jgi:hypothetical protein
MSPIEQNCTPSLVNVLTHRLPLFSVCSLCCYLPHFITSRHPFPCRCGCHIPSRQPDLLFRSRTQPSTTTRRNSKTPRSPPSSQPTMASDNTISEAISGTNNSRSDNIFSKANPCANTDNTASEFVPRTSISESDNVCDFFRVPRELRDQIYDLIFQEKEKANEGWHYKIRTASPKARLISRRFTKEYDQRPAINNFIEASECDLVCCGCQCHSYNDPTWVPSSLAAQTTALHINVVICQHGPERYRGSDCRDWGPHDYMNMRQWYRPWLEDLVWNLPLLGKVTMSVSCGNLKCATELQLLSEGNWLNVPNLSHIALLRPTHNEDPYDRAVRAPAHNAHSAAFFKRRETMATWTPAHGWQVDAEVTERCRKEESNYHEQAPE